MEVILVRHTRVAVPKGTCYGQTDVDVADTFEEEAAEAKKRLERYGTFDKAFTSPLSRARRLAAFCGYPDAQEDERLLEMNMGEWEMLPYDEIVQHYGRAWFDDYLHMATPGGESFQMQRARVEDFLGWLATQPYRRVAVFAHAGVLGCAGIYGGLYSEQHAWDNVTDYGHCISILL